MKYLISVVLMAVFFLIEIPASWCEVHQLAFALLHHLFHGNIFHLALNVLCVWGTFRRWDIGELILAYLIATVSWFAGSPSIGFSNMIFATIGLRTPSLTSCWWKTPTTLLFLAVTALMPLMPGVSGVTHIVAFVVAVGVASLMRWHKQIRNDSRRYIVDRTDKGRE